MTIRPLKLLPFLLLVLSLCGSLASGTALAVTDTALASVSQQMSVEELRTQKQEQLAAVKDRDISETMLELARLELETARVALSSLQLELSSLATAAVTPAPVPLAGQTPADSTGLSEPAAPEAKDEVSPAEQDDPSVHKRVVEQAIDDQKYRVKILEDWFNTLSDRRQAYQNQTSKSAWEERKAELASQRDTLLTKSQALKNKLADLPSDTDLTVSRDLRFDILNADESAGLIAQEIQIHDVTESQRLMSEEITRQVQSETVDESRIARAQAQLGSLQSLQQLLQRKRELLQLYTKAGSALTQNQVKLIESLSSRYDTQLDEISKLISNANTQLAVLADQKAQLEKRLLSARYSWPVTPADWQLVLSDLRTAVVETGRDTFRLGSMLGEVKIGDVVRAIALVMAVYFIYRMVRNLLAAWLVPVNRNESSYSRWITSLNLMLIKRNLASVFILGTVLLGMWLMKVPFQSYRLGFYLLLIIAVTKPILGINRLLHEQREFGLEWYDRPLYEGIRWSVLLGAILVLLTLTTHIQPVSALTRETFSRLLMVAVMTLSSVLLWRRKSILQTFEDTLRARPRVFFMLSMATLLFPLAGVITGGIGLLGYTNLSWTLGYHEGVILLAIAGWLVTRGLADDLFTWWHKKSTSRMPNGWIWAQAIISPLGLVVRVGLSIFFIATTFRIFGWSQDSGVGSHIFGVLNTGLFSIGKTKITVFTVMIIAASIAVFLWAAKWSREFAYRFVYKKIRDHGIRNSLSVFTQYAVVLIGGFTLLKLLGIDLTALTVLAGAIGVGIGFGMQTIANNFISGILLLIERPFRTGDIINIGGNEGTVTRIGIRSLSVKTWDNTEVIIPNTDTMSSAFVNWTHQDSIVRVMDYIGISYDADPHKAQKIILDIVQNHPEVVKEPAPKVWLNRFGDSSVDFRMHFFVDIANSGGLLDVKSKVMFEIWDAFKSEGIEIPYPQRDIHVRSIVGSNSLADLKPGDSMNLKEA